MIHFYAAQHNNLVLIPPIQTTTAIMMMTLLLSTQSVCFKDLKTNVTFVPIVRGGKDRLLCENGVRANSCQKKNTIDYTI